jgi:hypothetical protein
MLIDIVNSPSVRRLWVNPHPYKRVIGNARASDAAENSAMGYEPNFP